MPASAVIPIAASEVPVATLPSKPSARISSGTITMPPPTPKRALKSPATSPIATSFSGTARILSSVEADPLLARLAEAPDRTAILLDVDGVLAPIVDVPHEAVGAGGDARRAARGCTSGTRSSPASAAAPGRMRGASSASTSWSTSASTGSSSCPRPPDWSERLHAFAASIDWDDIERKPLTVTFHYRRAESEAEALTMLEAVAARARHEGLVARFGRKVLELRPPIGAHKGTAVAHLLGERGLERALYAGDDTTDLDAFDALQALELGVRVAVASPEGPSELREAADIVVDGPAEMLESVRVL